MEKETNLNKIFKLFFSKDNIEIQTLAYSLNLFLPTLILIISSFFQDYIFTAELGILIGVNIVFTQIFSANIRSLVLSKKNTNSLFSYIFFRLIISFVILILNLVILNYLNYANNFLLFLIAITITLQWQIELILTSYEIKKQNHYFYLYIFISLIFFVFVLLDFMFYKNLIFVISLYNFALIYYYFIGFFKEKKRLNSFKKIFISSINTSNFFSSLSISIVNLFWRIFIVYFCGKVLAGIFFASFALGSLPGTLFNNTFGPTIITNNIKIKNKINFFIYIYVILIILLSLISLYYIDLIFTDNSITQIFGTLLSLFGTYFMVKGLYARQYMIQKTPYQSLVFKYDILYSFFLFFIVPILYFFKGEKMVIISFLVSSIISFVLYSIVKKKILNKKK